MTKIISFLSAKGGTGKTTLTANLGVAMANMGKDVTVVDANITTPNLGLHLGIPLSPVTLHDVMKGKADIRDAVYYHDSGLKILPAGIALKDLKGIDARDLPNVLLELIGSTDYILIDGAAGIGREAIASIEASDETIIVTNPELTAVTDALKAIRFAEEMNTRVRGVVINRRSKQPHQLTTREIQTMIDSVPILSEISEEDHVQKAIAKRTPVVIHKPYSDSSQQLTKLAAELTGEEYRIKGSLTRRILSIFR
jgi:septum site-determining protein MinD